MSRQSIEIGHVVSVGGAKLSAMLVPLHEGDGEAGAAVRPQIGALVKVRTRQSVVFGMVSSLVIPHPSSPPQPADPSLMEIDLFGEALLMDEDGEGEGDGEERFVFHRGVSVYPTLRAPVFTTTSAELAQIYAPPARSYVRIGRLHQDSQLTANVIIDTLLGKHFAILGTTGSGKSCALALLLRAVLAAHPNGHVVLLDPHHEYARAFGAAANVITPDVLQLPYWLLNFEEIVEVVCSHGPGRESEVAILKEAILAAKLDYLGAAAAGREQGLTVDSPNPYRLSKLIQTIKEAMGKLDKPESSLPYLRLLATIESLRKDQRFAFMFGGLTVRDTLAEVVAQILRVPPAGKPITIFSLAGVPAEIVDVVVSLLCRMIFDFALWSARGEGMPVLLVCEEAHRYIPRDATLGFAPTRQAIARIAKEGRKYGVSLGLVTQRPSELSESILSQCNTLFALRMSNDQDQEFVRRALPETSAGLFNALPALRTQEAVVVGEGVTMPMRIVFDDLPEANRPHSETAKFSTAWQAKGAPAGFVARTIEQWRWRTRGAG